jgi:4-amino-4-deoxy-L-arabinose transferase-like glycosyltransferase
VRTCGIALLGLVAALYVRHLAHTPIYLVHDEIKFALQAHSIALSGRDLNGEFMPLYFAEPEFLAGRDPVSIYATALILRVLPLSERAIRLPTALVGVIDVVLMFLLARRVFKSEWLGLVAAGLLALTPAHFIHSRLGLDVLYPLPFLLAWLLCLASFMEDNRLRTLLAGTMFLGVGVYSYLACVVMMPLYFLLTCLTLRPTSAVRAYLVAAIGFGAPLVLLVLWQIHHPTRYAEIVGAYRPFDSTARHALGEAHGGFSAFYLAVSDRAGAYWNFFNPSFLFLTGDSSLINSTREVGVFLLPIAVLLPLGIYQIVVVRPSRFNIMLLCGLVSAPLAAVMMAAIEIRRALLLLPFAIVLATFGVERLLSARSRVWRFAAVLLLLGVPLQFRGFFVDYFGQHRVRSSSWFGGNLRGGLMDIIGGANRASAPTVYLSNGIPYVDAYWKFYTLAQGRGDLLMKTVYYDPHRLDERPVPGGALSMSNVGEDPPLTAEAGAWQRLKVITEPNGTASFVLYQKR